MKGNFRTITAGFAALLMVLSIGAHANSSTVGNFMLFDHQGKSHQLYYDKQAKASVIMIHGNDCGVVKANLAGYKTLRDDYAEQGVHVYMMNSNLGDKRSDIAIDAEKLGIDMPIMKDSAQIIGESLNVTHSGEVLVIDNQSKQLVYRGTLKGVRNALDAVISGKDVAVATIASTGCAVEFPQRSNTTTISYSETIAPLLMDKCVGCHRDGGIGPWAMSEYRMVQGFAPMMREVIRTKRMPPWHADPEVGHWQNDPSLSDEQTQTLVSWLEAGAPRGEGPDPLLSYVAPSTEWPLGEPDVILNVKPYDIPATGVVDYQYPAVANPTGKDMWVEAATVIPGDGRVVHHVLLGSGPMPEPNTKRESVFENYILGYAVGNETGKMPEGSGVFVPADEAFLLQMHYTPIGLATTDATRVGLYFADETPDTYLRNHVILDPTLQITPNEAEHEEAGYFVFTDDATLYSMASHSHYRGRSASYTIEYPNGESELLLNIPNYDFNWQRNYTLVEPLKIPKGSKMVYRGVFDNSANNTRNPDPSRTVPWGDQSFDEMLYGTFMFTWDRETSSAPIHSNLSAQAAQWLGFMDKNMDGQLAKDELPEQLAKRLLPVWGFLDADKDGSLNVSELEVMVKQMTAARKDRKKSKEVASTH